MKNRRTFLLIAAFFGFTGVALGAFGAHGLRTMLTPEYLAAFETAVRYQMYHTFALIAAVLLSHHRSGTTLTSAAWSFVLGTVLFSGSLYLLTLTGMKTFGAVTPLGGMAFLAGWLLLFLAAIKKEN